MGKKNEKNMKQLIIICILVAFGWNLDCTAQVKIARVDDSETLRGDVNLDGKVNITDVLLMLNDIIGQEASGYVKEQADLNGDSVVTITDVMMVVNIIVSANDNTDDGTPPVEDDQANPDFPVLAPAHP